MPIVIPTHKSTVETRIAQQPFAEDIGSFDTGTDALAAGVQNFAAGITQLQKNVDTTAAEEAVNNFESEKNKIFFDPTTGYFNTIGRGAMDQASVTQESLEKLKTKHSDLLKSPGAKEMFDRVAAKHVTDGERDILRHASRGAKAWEVATVNAGVENTLENAVLHRGDKKTLNVQNALGRQGVIDSAKLEGIDGVALNERLQTYDSAFARASITASIGDSAEAGKEAFSAMESMLEGPDKSKVEQAIKVKEKSEKTQNDAVQAIITANKLVDQHDSLNAIEAEVRKISDPILQDKTMTEARSRYNTKVAADKEVQASFYDDGLDHVTAGGTVEQFKAANPEAWEGMSSKQRNNLASGKHNITDQVLFGDLLTMPPAELAKLTAADYAHQLKPSDLSTLRTAITRANKGQSITSIQTPVSKVNSIAEQFFGRKYKKAKGEKKERVDGFMAAAQDRIADVETTTGKKLTPNEMDDVLAEFSHEIVIKRDFLGIDILAPDSVYDLENVPASELSAMNRLIGVLGEGSSFDVVELREFLIKNDIPVTAGNLSRAYEQATGSTVGAER